jgi:hypothetical protein
MSSIVKVSSFARDREREFFLVQLFITIILVYDKNIHGDGTVRSRSRAKNEIFTVTVVKRKREKGTEIKKNIPGAEKTVVLTRLYAIDKKSVYTGFHKCFLNVF